MCEIGYFQPKEGSVSCHKCEDPLTSTIPGSWNCTSCIDDYYFDTKKQTCEPCPDNAECKSASSNEVIKSSAVASSSLSDLSLPPVVSDTVSPAV